jgi:hypothetical protein
VFNEGAKPPMRTRPASAVETRAEDAVKWNIEVAFL